MDAKAETPRFTYNGEEYELATDLTLGESEQLEEYATGRNGAMLPLKSRNWFVWHTICKRHPEVTIEEVLMIPLSDLEEVGAVDPPVLPLPVVRNGSDAQHESEETLETGGSPPSLISTDSTLGT
jgi:hypothetical protein